MINIHGSMIKITLFTLNSEQDLHELGPGLNPRSTYLKRKGKTFCIKNVTLFRVSIGKVTS